MDPFSGIVREALIVVAVLCVPVLVVATIVGALVAIVQAATQVQEQTLTLLPKMIAVTLTIVVFGGFGMNMCASLFREAIALAPRLVRGGQVTTFGDAGLLVFARSAGFVFRAPGFSHPDVPAPVRAGLAFVLSLAFASAYASGVRVAAGGFVFAIAIEALVGAAIGTAASMLYDGAYAGGKTLDDYVGIKGSVPSANVAAGAGFGRLWSIAFVTGFFVLGGYRLALEAFAHTFVTLPPGALLGPTNLQAFVLTLPATVVRAAFFVAGPAIAIAFVLQCTLGIIARLVPRLSTFSLAFPIVFGSVLLATIAAMPWVLAAAGHPWMDLSALRAR